MNDRTLAFTRRRILATASLAIPALLFSSNQAVAQQSMSTTPPDPADAKRTALHQEIELPATPARIFEILLSSKQFTAFSGLPAEISPEPGGTFAMFSGQVVGRNIELVPAKRIVQAWRPADWPAGLYTLARFELREHGPAATTLILDHSSFPAGGYTHLSSGWHEHYWTPLRKYLG